ncbi:Flp/Fap pilin component [Sphingobium chlorophenolicum L-1]|uniref:Flp/Fap pilin component n=1 Tax=Sphingobium chlorophenolicum L-1 TaxID=690566 RepID=F6EWN5_SPHCR|nr:Flp family type IVb pilin [Sphingobium chlorophenolicum]AEG49007.1 Flp/Fap pilin component [Sphingobium chlorophenolicum L-1]
MRALFRSLWRLAACQRGATAVEYGLILALIVLAMMAGLSKLGMQTSSKWNNIATEIRNH